MDRGIGTNLTAKDRMVRAKYGISLSMAPSATRHLQGNGGVSEVLRPSAKRISNVKGHTITASLSEGSTITLTIKTKYGLLETISFDTSALPPGFYNRTRYLGQEMSAYQRDPTGYAVRELLLNSCVKTIDAMLRSAEALAESFDISDPNKDEDILSAIVAFMQHEAGHEPYPLGAKAEDIEPFPGGDAVKILNRLAREYGLSEDRVERLFLQLEKRGWVTPLA